MLELHEYLSQVISERQKKRRVLTWCDLRSEFSDFVGELVGGGVPDQCCIRAGSQLRGTELGIFVN